MTSLKHRDLWLLLLVILVGAAVRFYRLGHASIWLDEALTIDFARLPWSVLWVTPYDNSPPLYYSLIKILLNFGQSEFLLRLPSAVFGVLTLVVMYFAIRKIAGSSAAFMGALLLSVSFHNIDYSQEARAYALLGLCLSISMLGLVGLASRWHDSTAQFNFPNFLRAGGGLFALGLIAALYTHNIAVFYWLGAQFFFLAWWMRPCRLSRASLLSWTALNLGVLLLWIPWLIASLQLIEDGKFSWLSQPTPEFAFATWRAVHGFRTVDFAQPYADSALLLAAIVGIYSLRRNIALVALFLSLLVCSSLVIWAYGLVSTPVYMLRTILWGSIGSTALVGIGLSRLPGVIGAMVLAAFLAGHGKGIYDYYQVNFAEGEDWRSVAALINQNRTPNDILLIREPYVASALFYYLESPSETWDIYGWSCPQKQGMSARILPGSAGRTLEWKPSDISPDNPIPAKAGANLWLIESHCFTRDWQEADAVFFPNWGLRQSNGFKGIGLHWLVPAATPPSR